jgi:hypothetical protein
MPKSTDAPAQARTRSFFFDVMGGREDAIFGCGANPSGNLLALFEGAQLACPHCPLPIHERLLVITRRLAAASCGKYWGKLSTLKV